MGAYTKLSYHLVFGTKFRQPVIDADLRPRLYDYIGGTLRSMDAHIEEIGGIEDHVHILAAIPPTLAISNVVRDLKANASKWINDNGLTFSRFEWQTGYAAFTVSFSQLGILRQYIRGQEEHHRKQTFEDEYVAFLDRHGISYERKQIFEGENHG